jgi:YD repeat-containing protein
VIDAAGQIVQVGYDQGANAVGRVTSIGTETNSIGYQYDALGRIVAIQAVVDGKAKWLTYP